MHVSLAQSASVSEVMICLRGFSRSDALRDCEVLPGNQSGGRRGRSGLTDHVFSDAVTGGNVRSDHHADPCLTARGVTVLEYGYTTGYCGTNNKVVLGTTESTCVAYVGPAAARTQRSVSYASDGEFFIAYGLPTAHSKTHVDCPREVRNLRKVIDNGFFLWAHESSRTSAPVGCRSSRRG